MTADEYDFVIVGGGTSGLVIAARLSEDPNLQVLVVEAGANMIEDSRVRTPALFQALKATEADWGFTTQAQATLKGREINLSQGRALGGSSAINAHVFVPPSKTVIDSWEKLGNPGWNWNVLRPYYAKVYSLKPLQPELRQHFGINWTDENSSETTGPIQASYTGDSGDLLPKAWVETFKNQGYHMTEDPFSGKPMGAFSCLASIDPVSRERSYAATAYYVPAANRQNLHVLTDSTVEKILFANGEPKIRASGIQFQQNGEKVVVKARKEVILAAGSLQSPKMLEISGVGSADLLRSHDIDVQINNPHVGENLQDHLWCSIGFEAKDHVDTSDDLVRRDPKALETAMREYTETKTGLFVSIGVASYAYLPVLEFVSEDGKKSLQRLLDSHAVHEKPENPIAAPYYNISRSILESKDDASGAFLAVAAQSRLPLEPGFPEGPVAGKYITIGAMLSLPLSKGSVHINSSDPSQKPVIDPKYLTHPLDMEIFARHMRYIETIAGLEPLRSLLKENGRRDNPMSRLKDLETAKEYIQNSSISMWHPTSTCAMLPKDRGGVVDENLVVYGTSNLRIVDASVIPLIPRANVQSTVYAVAERAADLIKAHHRLVST
ncbi:hypothetical protein MMC22_004620 [Lobaria immixta]|nr:hypothetical protein [Lobaria immixta]